MDDRRLRLVLLAAALTLFVVQLDFFAINLALVEMARDLDTTPSNLQWAISGNMLALAALLILGGRLGDIYGRRRMLLVGLTVFGLASLGAGLAPSAGLVIAFRVLSGVGAALCFPLAVAVLANAYPADRVSGAIGTAYGVAAVGSASGPFVGGFLTEALSWRWVLLVLVPLAAVPFLLALRVVPESRDETVPRQLDWGGVVTVTLGIAAVTFAIDRAQDWGWLGLDTLLVFALGLALLVAFVTIERRVTWPLVDLSLFGNRPFDLVVAGCTVANVVFTSMLYVSTIYLQDVRGLTAFAAGALFLAPSISSGIGGPLSGQLAAALSERQIVALTNGVGALGVAVLALLGPESWVLYALGFFLAGLGLGTGWAYASVGTQRVVDPKRAGEASGVTLTVVVGLGGLFVAVSASVLRELEQAGTSGADATETILLALAALAALAALLVAISSVAGRARGASAPRSSAPAPPG